MADMIEQVKAAEEKADRIWQEVYGEKESDKAREPEAPKSEVEPNYVPIMAFQLGEQLKKISDLEAKIADISKPKDEPKKEQPDQIEENEKIKLLKEDYPEIAEGFTEIVKAMVGDLTKLKTDVDSKLQKVDQDVEKVSKETAKTKKEGFLASLDSDKEIGSHWRTINNDPEFIESLQEIEPYSGRTRHELLMDAFNGMDTERTARFFRDFQKGKTAKRANNDPIVTRQDLKNFYEDVRTGKWIGREKEASAEEIRLLESLGIQVKR